MKRGNQKKKDHMRWGIDIDKEIEREIEMYLISISVGEISRVYNCINFALSNRRREEEENGINHLNVGCLVHRFDGIE